MRDWKSEVRLRLRDLHVEPARGAQIVEELTAHLADRQRALVVRGMSEEDADAAVLQELSHGDALSREIAAVAGRVDLDPPITGDAARRHVVETLWQDIRYGARTLRRSPGFTAIAVLTLALGVGANTAIFTVVNAVVLRPLPFPQSDRLIRLWESNPEKGWPQFSASHPNFLDWRARARSFEYLAAQTSTGFTLTSAGGDAQIVRALAVTSDLLPALGVNPILGRNFRADEDRPGGRTTVAIVTQRFWEEKLGSSPSAPGMPLTLDGTPFEVVGVLPKSFAWGPATLDLLVPLAPDPARGRGDHRLLVLGRLRPGVSLQQAQSEMDGIAAQIARQYPESNRGWGILMRTFYDWIVPVETRQSLLIFVGAVGLVLLIACANVASLMLARAAARQKEISVRVALGARRSRIVSQLLVESLLLSLIASAIGFFAAWISTRWLVAVGPAAGLPRLTEVSVDPLVFAFALLAALAAGVLFGLLPAFQASRPHLSETLKDGVRTTGGAARQRLRSALVVGEVVLSVALLIGAGLLIRSFWRVQQVQPGFQTERLVTMRVNLPRTTYNNDATSRSFYERLLPQIAALPGVQAVATSSGVPLTPGSTATELALPGRTLPSGVPASADWRIVSPGYFGAMKIPLRGRDFDSRDAPPPQPNVAPPPVIIISEAFARRYWPNEDAIGKTVVIKSFGGALQTVIGVAGDVRSFGLDVDAGPMVYVSAMEYAGWNPMNLVIRAAGDPLSHVSELRAAIRQIDPQVPMYDITVLADALSDSLGSRRFNMYLLSAFAAIALTLAAIGLFGVLAYLVSQRTRDIGIRLALGAAPSHVFRLIVGQGMVLATVGALIGLAGALAAARVMKSLVFSIEARDPLTFIAVPLLLLAIALLACYLPARRALRVDPLVALRAE